MDLAKIRKKLKEKEQERKLTETGRETPVPEPAADSVQPEVPVSPAPDAPETVMPQVVPQPDAETGTVSGPACVEEEQEAQEQVTLAEFFVFRLSGELYAFKLSELQEVVKEQVVTLVPKMPDFIKGITSLRGKIIPVMNLGMRLSIKSGGAGKPQRGQLLILNGPRGLIGVMIDRVVGVRRISEELISETPSHLDEKQARFIESVVRDGDMFISILNLQEVLSFQASLPGRRT